MDSIAQSTSILIPAYNAGLYISELINRLRKEIGDLQIIIVDDGSGDGTAEIAKKNGAIVLSHKVNEGKGAALQTGFDFIAGIDEVKYVLTMDADLQHKPEDIKEFFCLQKKTDADIIIGRRKRIGTRMPVHRIVSNSLTSALMTIRTGKIIKDSQCGFRLIRKSIIDKIKLESKGYEAETEMLIKAAKLNSKIAFVPISTVYGKEKSHMTHFATTINFIKVLLRKYE